MIKYKNISQARFRKAFSLIEISIVLLIIGILVAGVSQFSRIIILSKVNSAKSLTNGSVVGSISKLELWLESISDASFLKSEAKNNSNLSIWKDINPQTASSNNVTKVANSIATYRSSGINGLPAVYFNGAFHATDAQFEGAIISNASTNYTLFIVYTTEDLTSGEQRALVSNGGLPGNGWTFQRLASDTRRCISNYQLMSRCATTPTLKIKTPEIVSIVSTGVGAGVFMYVNGTSVALSGVWNGVNSPTGKLVIGTRGGFGTWIGYVGEIIIYSKSLNDTDRKEIERYLGKKWGIAVK